MLKKETGHPAADTQTSTATPHLSGAEAYKAKKEAESAARKAAKELRLAEEAVSAAEAKIEAIEAELCKPEVYQDPAKAAELAEQLKNEKAALEAAYENWIKLQDA